MARVLVTRPREAAARTARRLEALGHEVIVAPLMETRALPPADWPETARISAVALTSERAVEAVCDDPRWSRLRGLTVFAVGERTAEVARAAGAGDVRAAGGTLGTLVDLIASEPPEGPVLYLAGRKRSGDLVAELAGRGIRSVMVEVYDAVPLPALDAAARMALLAPPDPGPIVAPSYSRRSAEALAAALRAWPERPNFVFLALSEQVAGALAGLGPCHVAEAPDEDALVALLGETC
ncbi:uroporphyrinogen-III synthase [Stappia sp. ICDLI1TA098]